jgi:glycerol-1-phosphate dehydrogenase [NAD(P)+]
MFHQNIKLPIIIEKIDIAQLDLKKLLNQFHLAFKDILVITGGEHSSKYAEKLIHRNEKKLNFTLHVNTQNSIEEVNKLRSLINDKDISLIIGVGGGRVLDTAKFLASKAKCCYLALPTIISSDALASPISILSNNGKIKSYPAAIPSGILIDLKVISSTEHLSLKSGLGDLLSNLSALKDWDLAISKGKAKSNNFARFLSEVAVSNIRSLDIETSNDFLDRYINSIIMSGLAMNIAGTSRPCSGAEHLLAHALNQLNCQESHGFTVGCMTPFCLSLHNQLSHETSTYFKGKGYHLGIIKDLIPEHDLVHFFALAKKVRGDRYTILNEFSNDELKQKYLEFINTEF